MSKLDEIQARDDAATEGPWAWSKGEEACSVDVPENRDGLYGPLTWDDHNGEVFRESDAKFIAHTREDVPKLVAALRAVEELCTTAEEHAEPYGDTPTIYVESVRAFIQQALNESIKESK